MAYFLGDEYQGTCFKLINDIDLTEWIEENNSTQGWMPIGNEKSPFEGVLDGNAHTVSGLFISRESNDFVGLFGYIKGATIKSLSLRGSSVYGRNNVGGLAGYATESSTLSCFVHLSYVGGTNGIGGILGYAVTDFTMNNCCFEGSVRGATIIGGLFGYSAHCTISHCSVVSDSDNSIYGGYKVGGLLGYGSNVTIKECLHKGNVSMSSSTKIGADIGGAIGICIGTSTLTGVRHENDNNHPMKGHTYIGGIVGEIASGSSVSFTNCHSSGPLENSGDYTGGIVGFSDGQNIASMTNCSHRGEITGRNYVGGLIGAVIGTKEEEPVYSGADYRTPNRLKWESKDYELIKGDLVDNPIKDCKVEGNILGCDWIGGIIGKEENSSTYTFVSISHSNQSGRMGNPDYQTSIVFRNGVGIWSISSIYYYFWHTPVDKLDCSSLSFRNCYYSGEVQGSNNVGGISGGISCGTIEKCYVNGSVCGDDNVGGIMGSGLGVSSYRSDNIEHLSVLANVAIPSRIVATSTHVGRIYGTINNKGTVGALGTTDGNRAYSKCEVIVAGVQKNIYDDLQNGTSIGLTALKNMNTYVGLGWDFDNDWTINNGKTFPYLRWEKKVSNIALNKSAISISIGEIVNLSATVTPSDADNKDIEWTSSDETIATVSNGVITAIGEGIATITATAKDGSMIDASCVVTVSNNNDTNPADFENLVYMESFSADAGDEVVVPILLKNKTTDEIANFDFYLQLPEGISVVLDEDDFPVVNVSTERTTSRKHSVYGDIESDSKIHIYSSSSKNTYFFSGTEGEVATITLKVADNAADGIYHIIMRNITMNRISSEETYSVARFNLSASIGDLSVVKTIADGDSYSATEDEHVDKLIYTRSFSSANKWQALYVPFSIPVETLTANGLEVAELNNTHMYDTNDDGKFDKTTLEFLYLKNGATEANYPYLIKSSIAGNINLSIENVDIKAAAEAQIECATTRQTFKIKGTYTGVSGTDMYNNNYYAMGGGSLVRVENAESGLKPQRWYLSIENKNGTPVEYYAPKMRIMINGMEIDEEETGIQDIAAPTVEDVVYTLDGRKMNASALPSGIYVKNHKKMIVQ